MDEGRYVQQVSIQIKLPTATRIHKIGLKARSDSERIKSWSLQAKNEDGVAHTIQYNIQYNNHLVKRSPYQDTIMGAPVQFSCRKLKKRREILKIIEYRQKFILSMIYVDQGEKLL